MGRLAMVADSVGGRLLGPDREFDSVSTDTRSLVPGQLFFALRGERFDAAGFVAQAAALGAAGAVVERPADCGLAQIQVEDTRAALGRFAAYWRRRFRLPLVGVTGSNGKTTVKEMIAAIFRAAAGDGGRVLATEGNLNNDIGVPLTLLRLRDTHAFAIIEMGANHIGEIAYLADIARPDVGLITNAGPAHLEGFGSLDGVARGKGEIYGGLGPGGIALINRDDAYYDYWCGLCADREIYSFGLADEADYRATAICRDAGGLKFTVCSPSGRFDLRLDMAGQHNIRNALAATAAALSAGADTHAVQQGLATLGNVRGRLRQTDTLSGLRLFDDSYNANPASVRAALEFLAEQPGETWFLFGDMGELGADSETLHAEVGRQARDLGIHRLLCVGEKSAAAVVAFGAGGEHFSDQAELLAAVRKELRPGVVALVKASRFMGLDRLAAELARVPGG